MVYTKLLSKGFYFESNLVWRRFIAAFTAIENYENWKEGSLYNVVLQVAGSALIAQIGNGESLNAALGVAASQLAAGDFRTLTDLNVSKMDPGFRRGDEGRRGLLSSSFRRKGAPFRRGDG
jgi:hypothetical protein